MYLKDEAATFAYAQQFASELKAGDCLALTGDLGAGKSVFARAIMRALGVEDEIMPSPTFSLIQSYQGAIHPVAHMDWYRLEGSEEILLAGAQEYLYAPWISLIEWPQRAWELLPAHSQRIHLEYADLLTDRKLTKSHL
ncbi:MAG: tRNA (adenosine(37)-N6)-threonylcarbamoyltransferase complex ATPase subunit type 1 TsaE [Mariprofundaceae bacterium]|nr:tRNA (adenosine(37)-N6)-threonylcarbamoyltransferase complex ATPase subunit type 1 TsaE [Mariprofundaceae bacterium]